MAKSLESEDAKLVQAKINELMQSEIDEETLQQLLQIAVTNLDKGSDKHASPSTVSSIAQNENPEGGDGIPENNEALENEVETEEFTEAGLAATQETAQTNEELANQRKLNELENQPVIDYVVPENITMETKDEKPALQEGFPEQSHHTELVVGSNVNESKGTNLRLNTGDHSPNEKVNDEAILSQSQAALSHSPSTLADNMGAFQINQATHIAKDSKLLSPVITPNQSAMNFDSAVPPIVIPLSKVGLYLPEPIVLDKADTPIPLPYKPLLVIKGQTAAIVFELVSSEPDKQESGVGETLGICGEWGKNLCVDDNLLSDSIENNLASSAEQVNVNVASQSASLHRPDDLQQEQHDLALKQPQLLHQQQPRERELPEEQRPEQYLHEEQQRQQQLQDEKQRQQLLQDEQQRQQLLQEEQQRQQQLPKEGQQEQLPYQQQPPYTSPSFTHQLATNQQCRQQCDDRFETSSMTRRSSMPPGLEGSWRSLPEHTHSNNGSRNSQTVRSPGLQPPVWMMDKDVKNCFHCGKPFTVTRRKHHCRGCGKIFCSDCCSQLAQLPYMKFKIARICVYCTRAIKKVRAEKIRRQKQGVKPDSRIAGMTRSASTVNEALLYVPYDETSSSFVGSNSIGGQGTPNQRSNFMAPETVTDEASAACSQRTNFMPDVKLMQTAQGPQGATLAQSASQNDAGTSLQRTDVYQGMARACSRSPVVTQTGYDPFRSRDYGTSFKLPLRPAGRTITWQGNDSIDNQWKNVKNIVKGLKSPEGIVIQAAEGLTIRIKKIHVLVEQNPVETWFLRSSGFKSYGQKEIAFTLKKRTNEETCPYELLKVYRTLYSMTLNEGDRFEHGNYFAFHNPLLGSEENNGFLFVSSNMVPRRKQNLPVSESFLFGILLKQSELHCAKYLPTRLLIALGVQQQSYPCPIVSCRDRPSVCNVEPNELFYSTFYAFNKFLNHRIPQALIPGVHILKSGGKVALELPFAYQTEIISIFESLLVDDNKPVTIPIAGDLVPDASGHFVYSPSDVPSVRRGFFVLQNNNHEEPGNQYLAFSSILLVLSFGEASSSHARFGVEVIGDGVKVTLAGSQAKEIRQSVYQGTNCSLYIGNADSQNQLTLRWTSDSVGSLAGRPKAVVVKQDGRSTKGYASTPSPSPPRNVGGQTNVIIDRVKTRDTEIAIEEKIVGNPDQAVRKLENDVRQACADSLVTFANRLLPNAEKRLNLTLSISPGYKKWCLGPGNQPIYLARSLQLALNEISVPETNGEITFVFSVSLQKIN